MANAPCQLKENKKAYGTNAHHTKIIRLWLFYLGKGSIITRRERDSPKEAGHFTRSPFQRDRDRIIHSVAFRRLKHKTQVFLYHEGDYFRTRLAHSLEVAQIARTMARALGLNEDIAEAVALAHDLGHPPFGHAGEDALNMAMQKITAAHYHNEQSLRVLTLLEHRYARFDGLNLTFETIEGVLKHNGPLLKPGQDKSVFAKPFRIWTNNGGWFGALPDSRSPDCQSIR